MKTARDKQRAGTLGKEMQNYQSLKCLRNPKYISIPEVDSERQSGEMWGHRLDTGKEDTGIVQGRHNELELDLREQWLSCWNGWSDI